MKPGLHHKIGPGCIQTYIIPSVVKSIEINYFPVVAKSNRAPSFF